MIRTQSISFFREDDAPKPTYYVHREHAFHSGYGGWMVPVSYLLVCPQCFETWGMVKYLEDRQAWPVSQYCAACGVKDDWHPVPGSILLEEAYGTIDTALLAALPEELIRREFDLHMKAYQP